MTINHEKVDLTIIGAGPTGLAAALLARSLGLTVCILDQADGPLKVGRADALNCRTQEYFEIMGILPGALAQGLKCNTSSTFEAGTFTSRQSQWWTSLKHTNQPNFLMLGQPDIEQLLLAPLDTPVRYNAPALSIQETETAGFTRFGNNLVESRYIIGADGAKSFVRKELGISFTGTKPEMVWVVLDAFIDTDFPICPEIITFQKDGEARISWIPRERGMSRFYVLLKGDLTQEAAITEIRQFLQPHRVDFTQIEWFSTFEVKERVAGSYFSACRRVVLAGDAAHVHSVNGGQGLNTGIADAFALVWRLHLAIRGHSDVLVSYETERREVAKSVLEVSGKLVRSTVRTAKEYVGIIEKNAAFITGAGIEYPPGTLQINGASTGDFVPGRRCPDLTVVASDSGVSHRIYQALRYGKYVVLQFSHVNLPSDLTEFFEVWHFDPSREASFLRIQEDMAIDQKAIVIRPDAYVGYCGDDPKGYLSRALGSSQTS